MEPGHHGDESENLSDMDTTGEVESGPMVHPANAVNSHL